jgi:hypothetical protein
LEPPLKTSGDFRMASREAGKGTRRPCGTAQHPKPKLVRCDRTFRFFLLHKATEPTSENHKAGIVSDKKRGTVR